MSEYVNESLKRDIKAQLDFRMKSNLITPIDYSFATHRLETETHPNLAIREGHSEILKNLGRLRRDYRLLDL